MQFTEKNNFFHFLTMMSPLCAPARKCCVLLRPRHWSTLPTEGKPEVADRSLSWLCFLMSKFSKNERPACDHWVWFLEWPQAFLIDLTTKSGATANLKIRWTRLENRKIWGLWSNRPGEIAVTREARLVDRKLVCRVPSVGRVAQWPGLSKTQHFRVGLSRTSKSVRPHCTLFQNFSKPKKSECNLR